MKLVERTGEKWGATIVGYSLQKGHDTLDSFHRTQVTLISYYLFIQLNSIEHS